MPNVSSVPKRSIFDDDDNSNMSGQSQKQGAKQVAGKTGSDDKELPTKDS